jgi:membrane protein
MSEQINVNQGQYSAGAQRVGSSASPDSRHFERQIWAHVQHNPLSSMWDLHGVPLKEVAKRTWVGINEDNLFGRASQLAYSFFSAIFPALIAMSAIMGMIAKSSSDLYFN